MTNQQERSFSSEIRLFNRPCATIRTRAAGKGLRAKEYARPVTGTAWIIVVCLQALMGFTVADGAVVTWTNTSGGNWYVATNWSPNQVPGPGDDAVITASGLYAVTLN